MACSAKKLPAFATVVPSIADLLVAFLVRCRTGFGARTDIDVKVAGRVAMVAHAPDHVQSRYSLVFLWGQILS
jgi:hypothetical protein